MSDCPRICIIGAGLSGICAGVQLKENGLTNYTIFDENEEVGGNWLANAYPGCACDVPTHLYSYSFHQNPNWTSLYCSQPEILEYIKDVARTFSLYENIKFHHQVKLLIWDESINKWRVTVYDKSTHSEYETLFEIVIRASGALREPNIPERFQSFKGPWMHSARWDGSIKLDGKTVGIIGSGASAIQIIPEIAKSVKNLIIYQRHAAWVMPKLQFNYPSWMKWMFKNLPGIQASQRASIFLFAQLFRSVYTVNSLSNKILTIFVNAFRKLQIGNDPELIKKLTPNYTIGCKRISPSDDYYPTMTLPNVRLIRKEITEVKEHSIVTKDGDEEHMDVLILATGFKVQDFFAPMEIKGMDGVNMLELWKTEGPTSYLGIISSIAPNTFALFGPYSISGTNSAIFAIECQVNWVVKVLKEMVRRGSKVVSVKQEQERSFTRKVIEDLKSTTWQAGNCASWHTNHQGVVTTHSPYTEVWYWNKTRTPDLTHLHFD